MDDFYNVDWFFWATFGSSVFSASKGIAGFLLNGPCTLIPMDGLFGGMGKMGFVLLVLNISCSMVAKGLLLIPFHEDTKYWARILELPGVIVICQKVFCIGIQILNFSH